MIERTVIEGHELRDIKKKILFSKAISIELRGGKPVLVITPEDGMNIHTFVALDFKKSPDEKDIA